MDNRKIAVIEDETDILEIIRYNLVRDGYQVCTARRGDEGLDLVWNQNPSLVILDLILPGLDGLSICQRLRTDATTTDIPIIMVSAKAEENDLVIGLGLGADDYLTKPFSPRVLLARVRAVLRRSESRPAPHDEGVVVGNLTIDTSRHEVTLSGKPVNLTATEFTILHKLASQPGRPLTRHQLLNRLGTMIMVRNIDVHIRSIRKKLGSEGDMIETVRGVGYRVADRTVTSR